MVGLESVAEGPKYIAFRLAEGDRCMTVVAALDPVHVARFPWAKWYSELAPDGEYLKAPLEYVRLSRAAATEMIQLIKAGQPLPPQFVSSLPVVW